MTDYLQIAMRETVKQCLEHSRHPPYAEPFEMDDRGQVTSKRVEPVDAFLRQLETWGYVVVSKHDTGHCPPDTQQGADNE